MGGQATKGEGWEVGVVAGVSFKNYKTKNPTIIRFKFFLNPKTQWDDYLTNFKEIYVLKN